MGVATLVSGLKNWLYVKKELMEQTDFWGVHENSEKPKIYFWVVVVKNGRGLFGLGNLLYLENELMK